MTYEVKAKCMGCGLHFAAYSWEPTWEPAHCPECGSSYPFMLWREEHDAQIYQFIPGHTTLTEFGAGTKPVET